MNYKRFVIVADNHGDKIDKIASAALFDFISDFKPTIRIHLGDNWNFDSLRKGASDEEKAMSLDRDFTAGEDFLDRYFSRADKKVLLLGNHDQRLYDLANNNLGIVRDYANDKVSKLNKIFRSHKAKVLPYDSRLGVFPLGDLNCLHGYYAGKGAATKHAMVYGNCAYGHTHNVECASVEDINGPRVAHGIGSLCQIDMPYNSRMPNKLRQSNGWLAGYLYADGTTSTFQVTRNGNRFLCPTAFKVY